MQKFEIHPEDYEERYPQQMIYTSYDIKEDRDHVVYAFIPRRKKESFYREEGLTICTLACKSLLGLVKEIGWKRLARTPRHAIIFFLMDLDAFLSYQLYETEQGFDEIYAHLRVVIRSKNSRSALLLHAGSGQAILLPNHLDNCTWKKHRVLSDHRQIEDFSTANYEQPESGYACLGMILGGNEWAATIYVPPHILRAARTMELVSFTMQDEEDLYLTNNGVLPLLGKSYDEAFRNEARQMKNRKEPIALNQAGYEEPVLKTTSMLVEEIENRDWVEVFETMYCCGPARKPGCMW